MQSYYEVNVALNGHHFFATAKRSATSERELKGIVKTFKQKFPKSEGYEISATYWQARGREIKIMGHK